MITIEITNTLSRVKFDNPRSQINKAVAKKLYDRLAYKQPGYQYTSAYQNGTWDGYIRLYNMYSGKFLTGLLNRVISILEEENIAYRIEDKRRKPQVELKEINLNGVTLRDYQIEAVEKGIQAGRGIFDMSVGAGKTEIAAALIQRLDVPTLFIVHMRTLLHQTKKRLEERLNTEVAQFGDGKYEWGKIVVASIQSLHRYIKNPTLKELVKNMSMVIVDEAHHVANNTYKNILQICDAYYRFGLSGTPLDREDGGSMITVGYLGEVIYQTKASDLIERNYLVVPEIRFSIVPEEAIPLQYRLEYRRSSDWREVYELGIVSNDYRNQMIKDELKNLLKEKRHILIVVKEIKHAIILFEDLVKEIDKITYLTGQESSTKIQKSIKDFKNGKIQVLIATPLFDEGVDIQEIDAIIMAGGGQSTIKTIQRLGRGIRKTKQKNSVTIVDFLDLHHPILYRHSMKRLRIYQRERAFKVLVPEKIT